MLCAGMSGPRSIFSAVLICGGGSVGVYRPASYLIHASYDERAVSSVSTYCSYMTWITSR